MDEIPNIVGLKIPSVETEPTQPTWINVKENGKAEVLQFELVELLSEKYHLVFDERGGILFYYDDNQKYYKRLSRTKFGSMVLDTVQEYDKSLFNHNLVANTYKLIQYVAKELNELKTNEAHREGLLNLKNCLLDPVTTERFEHTSDIFTITKYSVRFDKDRRSSLFEKFIKEITLGDTELSTVLQEVCGYITLHTTDVLLHKLFIFFGNGKNGKGALSIIILNMLDPNCITAFTLPELSKSFNRAELLSSQVNYSSEEEDSGKLLSSTIKKITVGDTITAEVKFGDIFSFKSKTKLLVNVNHLLQFEINEAIMRRILIIPFNYTVPDDKVDVHLLDKLTKPEEQSAILNWCLIGYQRLVKNKYNLSESREVNKMLKAFKSDNSIVNDFIEDRLEKKVGSRISHRDLHFAYASYLATNGLQNNVNSNVFIRELKKALNYEKISWKAYRTNGVRGIEGISLKQNNGKYSIN